MTARSPLHRPHGPTSPAAIAHRLAAEPRRWCALVEHVPDERRYARLPIDEAEAWVISSAPGTGLALHDHGEAAGALAVVAGSLVEHHGTRQVPGLLRERLLRTGTVVAFAPDHVHRVENVGSIPAVSIHVYAPSLDHMTFFGDDPRDDRTVRGTRMETQL